MYYPLPSPPHLRSVAPRLPTTVRAGIASSLTGEGPVARLTVSLGHAAP